MKKNADAQNCLLVCKIRYFWHSPILILNFQNVPLKGPSHFVWIILSSIYRLITLWRKKWIRCESISVWNIPDICHFFTWAKFLENKIYIEKTRNLRQNTQKIANFLRYYGKIHSKLAIFCVKSVKIYTGQKNSHENSRGFRDKYEVWV